MKLIIVTKNDTVVETIENLQEYDLDKPFAQAEVLEQIREAVERGRDMEEAGI